MIGPKEFKLYSCKKCKHCKDEYDIIEHWVELFCDHPEINHKHIGYLDHKYPFPKEFTCPINKKKRNWYECD